MTVSRHIDERGFIVVAALWILSALAALALIYLSFVTNTATVAAGSTERIQTDALASAAVELTVYQLTASPDEMRPSSGTFSAKVGSARVSVAFRSEAAFIDLNAAPKALLSGLFAGLGVTPANAEAYADRIVAWRTPTEAGDDNPENSFYRTSGLSYLPRHAPFPQVEELWLVRGIPDAVVAQVLPFVTVFSNRASVNVLDAAPQVLAALPGMTPERLQQMLAARNAGLPPPVSPGQAGEGASQEESKAYRLTIAIAFNDGRRAGAEAVIFLLDDGDAPYRVLSWRNTFDGRTER